MAARPWSRTDAGVIIHVRLTPRASADQIDGERTLSNGRTVLSARVRAVPEDGKANEALLHLIARWLDVRASDCALQSGDKSRLKSVLVKGDVDRLSCLLDKLATRTIRA
jgi:uncharacterized protein (TIGR00251 family)